MTNNNIQSNNNTLSLNSFRSLNIINFLNKNNIKWQPIDLKIEIDKKIPIFNNLGYKYKMTDFYGENSIDDKELKRRQNLINQIDIKYIAIDTSYIQQIDVDNENDKEKYLEKFNNPYFLSSTKKLPHIFIKVKDIKNYGCNSYIGFDLTSKEKKEGKKGNDILIKTWSYCDINAKVFNYDKEIKEYDFNYLRVNKKKYNNIEKMPPNSIINNSLDVIENIPVKQKTCLYTNHYIQDLLKQLHISRIDSYEDWIKVGMILKNENLSFDLWNDWSKNSSKYDNYENTLVKWNSFSYDGNLSINTLIAWVNEDIITNEPLFKKKEKKIIETQDDVNEISFTKLMDKLKTQYKKDNGIDDELDKLIEFSIRYTTDQNIAKVIHYFIKDNTICSNIKENIIYYFNNVFWEKQVSSLSYLINIIEKNIIFIYTERELLEEKYNNLATKYNIKGSNLKKNILNCIHSLQSTKCINNIQLRVLNLIFDKNFENKIDNQWNLFAFNNKILDITTNQFIIPTKEQYITMTTGYDYQKTSIDKINELRELLSKAFIGEYKEDGEFYLTYLSTGLEGRTLEKFCIANGGGGNQKGVINELGKDTLGDYAYNGHIQTILNPIKDGVNVELKNMHKKRLIIWGEPPIGKKLNSSTICKLTGGEEINGRGLYDSNTSIKLSMTSIIECNKRPPIDTCHDGMKRRLYDILFRSSFVDIETYNDLKEKELLSENIFIGDVKYKEKSFRDKYKLAFFEILREYYQLYKNNNYNFKVPQSIKNRTQSYFEISDEFYNWFEERYEKSNDKKDYVLLNDIYEKYKCSDFYSDSTRNKRKKTFKSFKLDNFVENGLFKNYFKERYNFREEDKVKSIRNVLLYHKEIIREKDNLFRKNEDNYDM